METRVKKNPRAKSLFMKLLVSVDIQLTTLFVSGTLSHFHEVCYDGLKNMNEPLALLSVPTKFSGN